MKIFIVHHHLRGGGVTRVIESQVKSLCEIGVAISNIKVLCGFSEANTISDAEVIVHPELDYIVGDSLPVSLREYVDDVKKKFRSEVSLEDIIHIHNYGLGKNPLVTVALFELLAEGFKIVNHCHDFAEDRPSNMDFFDKITDRLDYKTSTVLYPESKNMEFAVLNRVDFKRLESFGVNSSRIKFLPNPIDHIEFDSVLKEKENVRIQIREELSVDSGKKIVTYPVRVIRRKNIKELILLSILFKDTILFAVTLPPTNSLEIEEYEKWKNFVAEHNLPVLFEVGNIVNFKKLIAGSDFCITTSVMEGFGMTFLEPWLLETPVVGRDLSYVTDDFKFFGMKFPMLYNGLYVSVEGTVTDFKDLNFYDATKCLESALNFDNVCKDIINANNWLSTIFDDVDGDVIRHNSNVIKENFSIQKYGKDLNELYKKVHG